MGTEIPKSKNESNASQSLDVMEPLFRLQEESTTYKEFQQKLETHKRTLSEAAKTILDRYIDLFTEEYFNEKKKSQKVNAAVTEAKSGAEIKKAMQDLLELKKEQAEKEMVVDETTVGKVNSAFELLKAKGIKDVDEIKVELDKPSYASGLFQSHMLKLLNKIGLNSLKPEEKVMYHQSVRFFKNFEISKLEWKSLKSRCKSNKQRVVEKEKNVKEMHENLSFDYTQQQILGDSKIKLQNLELSNHGNFIDSLSNQIYGRLKKIADVKIRNKTAERMRNLAQQERDNEAKAAPAGRDGKQKVSDTWASKGANKALSTFGTAKTLQGIFNKEASLMNDPMIFHLFKGNTEEINNFRIDLVGKGKDGVPLGRKAIEVKLKKQLNIIFHKDDFDRLKNDLLKNKELNSEFLLNEAAKGTEVQKEEAVKKATSIADLLDTMPSGWHKSKWGIKYEKYVLAKGELSLTFSEWKETQNISFFENIFYDLIKPIMNFFENMGEEDQEKLEENFQSHKYRQIIDTALGKDKQTAPIGIDTQGNPIINVDSLKKSDAGKNLITAFENQAGSGHTADEIDLKVNGAGMENATEDDLEKITKFIAGKNNPNTWKLLTKGLEIKDVLFLANHQGDNDAVGDGINVAFDDNGFKVSIELEDWMEGKIGAASNEIVALGAGGAAAYFFPGTWIATGIGAVLAGATYFVGGKFDIGWGLSTDSFSYADISNKKLSDVVKEAKLTVGKIKNELEMKIESFKSLPEEDRKFILENDELWSDIPLGLHNRNITHEDIDNFKHFSGKDIDGGFDNGLMNKWLLQDVFHKEIIDKGDWYVDHEGNEKQATDDIEKVAFEVNGTGSAWGNLTGGISFGLIDKSEDLKFIDTEGFFLWLAKNRKKEAKK